MSRTGYYQIEAHSYGILNKNGKRPLFQDRLNQSYKTLSGEGGNAANDETWRIAA
jgi:hypothetical protein